MPRGPLLKFAGAGRPRQEGAILDGPQRGETTAINLRSMRVWRQPGDVGVHGLVFLE